MAEMKEAMFYERLEGSDVRCNLCSHNCRIRPGHRGICGVRENINGTLYSLVYGKIVAEHVDPVEKKPLFHFQPGSRSYSIATVGCNFRCRHCQNADISQMPVDKNMIIGSERSPEDIVAAALEAGVQSISYTYTEPTIFFEFALDTAVKAKEFGLKNNFVSNGYMSEAAARAIAPYLDAINIDLKGDDEFYKKICSARVEPVKRNIELFPKLGVWTEVTTLVIPGYNDSVEQLREIAEFLAGVSVDIPWHVSAFYPTYRLRDAPPTSAATIRRAMGIGREAGIRYIYAGNIPGEGENTHCHNCGELLVERFAYRVTLNSIVDGRCPRCRTQIPGVW
nr:AmmeMemoRadiSam system radical SAM enzyme [Methanothrix sp.]